jgi:hypothetical protein
MRFIFAPFVIAAGILTMRYTFEITNFTGKIDFAENWFGGLGAGTYTWWRLVGLAVALFGGMWLLGITSLLGDALGGILAIP